MLKNRIVQITLATVALLLLVIVIGQRPARIAYHHWRMKVAEERKEIRWYDENNGVTELGEPGSWEAFERHRNALVKLDRIKFVEYRFKNVTYDSPTRDQIWAEVINGKCPDMIDTSMPHFTDSQPLIINIWCNPKDESDWIAFFATHDQSE